MPEETVVKVNLEGNEEPLKEVERLMDLFKEKLEPLVGYKWLDHFLTCVRIEVHYSLSRIQSSS